AFGDLDAAEPHFVGVGGQHETAFTGGKTLLLLELAGGDHALPFLGLGVGLADEFAIEPMRNLAVLHHHLAGVPLAGRVQRLVSGWGLDVVNGGGGVAAALHAVGVLGVVNHLVLNAQPLLATDFGDPVLDAVVAACI